MSDSGEGRRQPIGKKARRKRETTAIGEEHTEQKRRNKRGWTE